MITKQAKSPNEILGLVTDMDGNMKVIEDIRDYANRKRLEGRMKKAGNVQQNVPHRSQRNTYDRTSKLLR